MEVDIDSAPLSNIFKEEIRSPCNFLYILIIAICNDTNISFPYIRKTFAGITDNSGSQASSKITPVEKYGTIYSPGGYKVSGYAKSYIIDGGAESYVRKDLTDGWHIKAVNEYYDGYYWYELYDADDGDYYGWVSAEVINFY